MSNRTLRKIIIALIVFANILLIVFCRYIQISGIIFVGLLMLFELYLIIGKFEINDHVEKDLARTDKSGVVLKKETDVTFASIGGLEDAKESLKEVIDFLENPHEYAKIGAQLPKGALLIGPPGTGKTLLARAVAGESNVPFINVSGSDFVEIYAGMGAARVRRLFEVAEHNAPCIIFIDEIDTIAKKRSGLAGASNDEREQTLNQLLSEMDGFNASKGIVVLAATNRPEILDPAILRQGRMDRQIVVERPDLNSRLAILETCIKKVKTDKNLDLEKIAYSTSGATGSDLSNIINEAAILAVKENKPNVSQKNMEEATEKIVSGYKKNNIVLSDMEKCIVAMHEAAKAVAIMAYDEEADIQKISIIPRGSGSYGYTLNYKNKDKKINLASEMLTDVKVALAGYCAERNMIGDKSSASMNDIKVITQTVREMITTMGMSDDIGPVYMAKDPITGSNCSSETAYAIDMKVISIIHCCMEEMDIFVSANIETIQKIAEELVATETLDGGQIKALIKGIKVTKVASIPIIETPLLLQQDDKKGKSDRRKTQQKAKDSVQEKNISNNIVKTNSGDDKKESSKSTPSDSAITNTDTKEKNDATKEKTPRADDHDDVQHEIISMEVPDMEEPEIHLEESPSEIISEDDLTDTELPDLPSVPPQPKEKRANSNRETKKSKSEANKKNKADEELLSNYLNLPKPSKQSKRVGKNKETEVSDESGDPTEDDY